MSRHTRNRSSQTQPTRPSPAKPAAPAPLAERPERETAAPHHDGPAHDWIAVRAYHLWETQGRPDGSDREHWLEAERQLRAEAR
jgi:hypothetical protein